MNDKKYNTNKVFISRVIMTMKSTDNLDNIRLCCEMILDTIERLHEDRKDDSKCDSE